MARGERSYVTRGIQRGSQHEEGCSYKENYALNKTDRVPSGWREVLDMSAKAQEERKDDGRNVPRRMDTRLYASSSRP